MLSAKAYNDIYLCGGIHYGKVEETYDEYVALAARLKKRQAVLRWDAYNKRQAAWHKNGCPYPAILPAWYTTIRLPISRNISQGGATRLQAWRLMGTGDICKTNVSPCTPSDSRPDVAVHNG